MGMSRDITVQAETLAKAAILFCQKTYQAFPGSRIDPHDDHYSDEALTLEVHIPRDIDVRQASDELLRIALEVEDQYGTSIIAWAVPEQEN
jgi:hypothetical protein